MAKNLWMEQSSHTQHLQSTNQSCNLKEPPLIIQGTPFATRSIFEKPFLTRSSFKNKSDLAVDKMTAAFATESEIKVTLSAFPWCHSCASSVLWAGLVWGLQSPQGPARTPQPGPPSQDPHPMEESQAKPSCAKDLFCAKQSSTFTSHLRNPKGLFGFGVFFFCREKVFLFYFAKIAFDFYSAVPKQG